MDETSKPAEARATGDRTDPRGSVLEAAHSILSFHVAADDGFCAGCRTQWNRLVFAPCEQGRWAVLVVETHGVAKWSSFGQAA